MPSKQETFDIAAAHLLRQGVQCADERGCLYRGPNGLKCVVGALIPDDEYVEDMDSANMCCPSGKGEGMTGVACNELVQAVLTKHGHDLDLCNELQLIHDECDPESWDEMLEEFSHRRGLEYTPESLHRLVGASS